MTVLKYRKGHQFSAQKEIDFSFLFEKSVACARGGGGQKAPSNFRNISLVNIINNNNIRDEPNAFLLMNFQ